MNKLLVKLPMDIINHILYYDGTIKYRNGMYMNQLPKTDKRYEMLRKCPRKSCEHTLNDGLICYRITIRTQNYFITCVQNHPNWLTQCCFIYGVPNHHCDNIYWLK
jgi:hypothetical protein